MGRSAFWQGFSRPVDHQRQEGRQVEGLRDVKQQRRPHPHGRVIERRELVIPEQGRATGRRPLGRP